MSKILVPQKSTYQKDPSILISILTIFSSYVCIIPLVVLDVFLWQFQHIYFRFHNIPQITRKEYVIIDRYELKGLYFWQKVNCVYCGYANGIVAFAKAIVNQMEIYSCAIKHVRTPEGQEHHTNFYDRSKFE